jgi:alpha-methylacyl-CoA racemase
MFEMLNAGKLGLGLNLKSAEAASVVHRLAPHYDIVVEGNRPGVMDRLGIGYEALSRINPKLVYCSISGYGASGPLSKRAGHDVNYMATAGLLGLTASPDGIPPTLGFQAADASGALQAVIGILSAVIGRGSTGKGQFVDVSMTEACMVLGLPAFSQALYGQYKGPGAGLLDGGLANYNIYATADGRHISVGALEPHFWIKFCKAIGREDCIKGKKKAIQELFSSKSYAEWIAIAEQVDACIEPVLRPDELSKHPQHASRRVILESATAVGDDGIERATPQLVLGPRIGEDTPTALPPASTLGEHSGEVLRRSGFSEAEISALVDNKTIHCD